MRLKRLRDARGLSQTALAEKAGISRGYLARLEAAQQDPTLTVVEKLAKALKISVAELLKSVRSAAADTARSAWPITRTVKEANDEHVEPIMYRRA
jgi:transcriptional regulator with XRE-family HTH domain